MTLRSPWVRLFLAWTVVLLGIATVVGIDALMGINRANDDCFFQTGPCPQAGDPDFVQLDVAFFVIPLVWLVGVLLGVVLRSVGGRRRGDTP